MEPIRSPIQTEHCPRHSYGRVCEQVLPTCVRDTLEAARTSRPEHDVVCISFHTHENGHEIARMEPEPRVIAGAGTSTVFSRLHPKDLLVLSVAVTETTFERVNTVTHVLVARMQVRSRGQSGGSGS